MRFIKTKIIDALHKSAAYAVHRDSKLSVLFVFLFGLVTNFFKQVNVVPVEWLDENTSCLKKTLVPEEYGYSYGPLVNGSQKVEQVLLPAIKVYCFENARVTVTSSSVLIGNRIIIERVVGVDVRRCDFSSGHVVLHGQKIALVNNGPTEYLEQGIFLGGNGSFNYYHWMIEILPKLRYLNDLDGEYEKFPILVCDDVDNIKICEALHYTIKDRPTFTLYRNKTYLVGKLLFITTPNNAPFNLRQRQRMKVSDFLTRASSIEFLQNSLGADLARRSKIKSGERIFMARQAIRRNYNQEEVFKIFKQKGFRKVFMEEYSLRDQINLISQAELIAGPTGAAWANLVFCRKGVKCLCWMAEEYGDFAAFSNLATIVGADLRYITYRTEAKSTEQLHTFKYYIDPKNIQRSLEDLLAQ